MKNYLILLVAFALYIMSCTETSDTHDFEHLASHLDMQYNSQTAGIALAVVSDSSTIWSGAYGMADIASGTQMTTDHTINIASVSKLFVATCIMRLAEKGILHLDDDVNKYLEFDIQNPQFFESPITIRHLLTHRSSIVDTDAYGNSYAPTSIEIALSDWLSDYFNTSITNQYTSSAPGEEWLYSNVGYGLLAVIVEQVTSMSFEQYCQENIFDPLKMTNTAWKHHKTASRKVTAYAYSENKIEEIPSQIANLMVDREAYRMNTYMPFKEYHYPNYPDGELYTSLNDLTHFAKAILNDGYYQKNQLLTESSIDQMIAIDGDPDDKQGICWRYTGMGDIWGHGGDDPGVQTGLYLDKHKGIAMLMIKNSNVGSRTDIMKNLYQAALADSRR